MSYGSADSRQLNNFLQVGNQLYPLAVPGAKTFFVAPSGYVAVGRNAVAANDNNDGETPTSPLASISRAHTLCVAGRGDTIVLMPGTHTITATSTARITKSAVRLVSLRPYAATLTADGVETVGLKIDANDVEVAGIRFLGVAALVTLIHVADTSAVRNFYFHHNKVIGLETVAGVTGLINGENLAGNDAAQSIIEHNEWEGLSASCLTTYGGGAKIQWNQFNIDDTAAATGLTVGDLGAAFATRKACFIKNNAFTGQLDNGSLLCITVAGIEAQTQILVVAKNDFSGVVATAHTKDIHPEGWLDNYVGHVSAVPVICDPT